VIELDHVLIAVDDLANGALAFEYEHGVVSYEGGRHPDWGTANRIVPLGDAYLELVAAVDREKAMNSPFGRWVLAAEDGQPLGWAVRGDLDEISRRLSLPVSSGSRRQTAEGPTLSWRFAGVEQAAAEPFLPFFIEWESDTQLPGERGTARLARLELQGDAERLDEWLGEHELPIVIEPGAPAVVGFAIG
jgi:hypothetical protein